MKKCPYCAEEIQDEAIYCRWCEKYLAIPTTSPVGEKNLGLEKENGVALSSVNGDNKLSTLLFSSKGRISRRKYWGAISGVYLIGGLAGGMVYAIFPEFFNFGTSASFFLVFIFFIAWLTPMEMLIVKRFHDLNKSGWFSILAWLPPINIIIGWILILKKGTDGSNIYGEITRD